MWLIKLYYLYQKRNKFVLVDIKDAQKLFDYLITKPYTETYELIDIFVDK